ncbi:MAG: STAS domain-containing protein [Chloroflexota bacterium]|mgnify:FL=1|jgi:anti-anti-sigma factor|nr:STAS domain-containing protein [Anaerolineae bacterium]MCZ2096112.1 STAS domain-containing protein [Anaerolineae bacterium]
MVMEINSSEMKRVQLFEVLGRVDSTNAAELGLAMDRAADEGRSHIVLDLGGVEYMSSAGLREMVRVLKRVKRAGGDLRIANPSDRVREVLELAGLDTIFEIYSTQVEAVGSF